MALYRYVKNLPKIQPSLPKKKINHRLVSFLLVAVGLVFLANAAYPIVSYQLLVSPHFSTSFVSPSTEAAIAQSFGTAQDKSFGVAQDKSFGATQDKSLIASFDSPQGAVLGEEIDFVDFTKASNWFPETKVNFNEKDPSSYILSIPKLNIKEAAVWVGMEDLKKSLIQYPGTPLPGRFGNTVIFGHSVLPQFFNPKNYTTIFSTLPTLKPKDEIWIDYNQVKYKYLVEQMIEVQPNDISILAQRYDDSYLTLITCVPPGTYLRRLIVRARLTKI
ncbi:MAG: sortase [Patescibacteria group bacterium]|nr:sortase [Patescibacteria group bacterium]